MVYKLDTETIQNVFFLSFYLKEKDLTSIVSMKK